MKINSLFIRILLICLVVTISIDIISISTITKNIEENTSERLISDALLVLHSLDWAFTPLLEKKEMENIQRLVENVGSSDLVKTLKIVSNDQTVMFANADYTVGPEELSAVNEIFNKRKLQFDIRLDNNNLLVAVPIRGKSIDLSNGSDIQATLLLQVDEKYEKKLVREFYLSYTMLMILTTTVFLGIIAVVLFVLVAKPLRKFRTSIKHVTKRDYSHKIDIKHSGEFQELAKVYNLMLDKVSTHTEELNTARSLAETSTISKSEFLAKVSHELLTPINTIIGFNELLEESETDEQKINKLSVINRSSKTLLQLVKDLLDISEFELEKMKIDNEVFDIRILVESVYDKHIKSADEKKLSMVFNVHSSVPKQFIGDHKHLEQLIDNLIGNAIKFTNSGYVKLSVVFQNDMLEIRVTDSGIGIEPDIIETIFTAFNQSDNSLSRSYNGTGLGLALCKKITEVMDGSIDVKSRLHEGTTFNVRLKLLVFNKVAKSLSDDNILYSKLSSSFIRRLTDVIIQMDQAIEADDWEGVMNLLHMIKGTSGNLGLNDIHDLVSDMYTHEMVDHDFKSLYKQLKVLINNNQDHNKSEAFHVLIVDQNVETKSIVDYLSRDFDIDIADSILESLEMIFARSYDVFIFDVNLSDVSNEELFELLDHNENDLYIIGIVDKSSGVDKVLDEKLDWFLSKPINKYLLESKLKNIRSSDE